MAVSRPEQVGRPARPALPAAGETSAAAAGTARQPSGVSGSSVRSGRVISRIFRLCRGAGRLHHQGPEDDPGQVLFQRPDGGWDGTVRLSGQRVRRSTLQASEETRGAIS